MTSDPKNQGPRVSLEDMGRKLDSKVTEVSRRVSEESERAVQYLNSEVVPAIRDGSSKVLREAATRLQQLAEYLDKQRTNPEQPSRPGGPADPNQGNPSA